MNFGRLFHFLLGGWLKLINRAALHAQVRAGGIEPSRIQAVRPPGK